MNLRAVTARLPVDQAIHSFMSSHHGVIDLRTAVSLGATPMLIKRRVTAGQWVRVHRGVYRAGAAPVTAEQALLAAVWACGPDAVASHRSAAWLRGLLAAPPDSPEVSVPSDQAPVVRGVRVHRSTDLVGSAVAVVCCIPTTDPARTVLDAAGVVSPLMVEVLIDRAVATKLITVADLVATLERYGRRGRRGAGKLRIAPEERGVHAAGRIPSVLESQMARLVRLINAPPPTPEFEVAGGRYRFDFAWPEVKVAVEVDGWAAHSAYADWTRNLGKDQWANEHDWIVCHVSAEDIRLRPEATIGRIAAVLRRRRIAEL